MPSDWAWQSDCILGLLVAERKTRPGTHQGTSGHHRVLNVEEWVHTVVASRT